MIVFLASVLVALSFGCLALTAWVVREKSRSDDAARDERAFYTHAIIAKNSSDMRLMVPPAGPAVPKAADFFADLEGYDAPVGL